MISFIGHTFLVIVSSANIIYLEPLPLKSESKFYSVNYTALCMRIELHICGGT